MADTISRTFARWAANLKYADLPAEVVDKVKALMLLPLVSAVFGAATDAGKHAVHLVTEEAEKPNGATLITTGTKAERISAAFANSELMHCAGLFDSYRMLTHPGPVVMAVALVNGELHKRSLKEIITALAAGYEFECRLADDFIPSTAARGFRPAPIYSTMGGSIVAAKLMGLDEQGIVGRSVSRPTSRWRSTSPAARAAARPRSTSRTRRARRPSLP